MNAIARIAAHPALAEAEILRLRALLQQRWQPIETAPKDGTPILAAVQFTNLVTGYSRWEQHAIWYDDEFGGVHPDTDHGWEWDDYLYWMPLPPAPLAARTPTTEESDE